METKRDKIEKYLEIGEKILRTKFQYGETYAELILGTIEIAKMLQREELDGLVISGTPTPHIEDNKE